MRALIALCALLLVPVAAGCADAVVHRDVEPSPPPETIGEGSATLVGGEECTNPEAGYTVSYPDAWYANNGTVTTACTIFDDAPVRLRQQTEVALDLGVIVGTAPGTVEQHAQADGGIAIDERTEATVDGHQAIIVRGRGTGDALIPEGTRVHRYVVDVGEERILLASTYDTGDAPFARKIEVLDAMMSSLTFEDDR